VVGINIGGGTFDGYKFGHGAHVASLRRHFGWPEVTLARDR
jgi:hypothetical protein